MAQNRPLSGLDAAFLYLEGLGTPMHVGSLMVLDPPSSSSKKKDENNDFHQRLRAHVADRLSAAAPLRRVLEDAPLGLSHPIWREHAELDLDWHIQKRKLRAPGSQCVTEFDGAAARRTHGSRQTALATSRY